MKSALIISSTEKSIKFISDMLVELAFGKILTVSSGGEARRLFIEKDFDLCIINAPLIDESGESLAKDIADIGVSEVILLLKSELFDEVSQNVEEFGVMSISKPVSRSFLWNALKFLKANHKRIEKKQDENKKLQEKIEDIRIVDRAKCILISQYKMTESDAHRCIEKQAMDMRVTKRAIAEYILKYYEN